MAETNEDEEAQRQIHELGDSLLDKDKRSEYVKQELSSGEPIPKTPPERPVPPPVSSSNVDDLTERRIGILALAATLFLIGVSVGLWIAEGRDYDGG